MPKDELNTANQQEPEQEGREPNTLLHEDEVFRDGFTQVSNRVLRARNLSAPAKTLYAILLSYSWQADSCFPGYTRLCEDMGLSEKIVRKYMHELEAVKLLSQKRRGLGMTNIYTLLSLKNANLEAERDTSPVLERDTGNNQKRDTSPDKEYSSKNTQNKNTKSFRKGKAFQTEKGEEDTAPARSHRARMTTRNQKAEAETREQKGRGVTFAPNGEGTTNKQDVRERYQQVTPTSMIPKSGQENTERGTNVPPLTKNQAHSQKRTAKNEASKQRTPTYIGKPLTQDEIDEKRRRGQNASGFTPLAGIIPASHWQELEACATATNGYRNGNGNGGLHYHHTTKNAPLSIDATIEQLSTLLHDEPENTAQNINRAAKLCKQVGYDSEQFANLLWSIYHELKKKPDKLFKTRRADGRANKMPVFFTELEKAVGVKPKLPN